LPSDCHSDTPARGEESHGSERKPGTKNQDKSKKVKVKRKKFISYSSKSPDFEGSDLPSDCHSDTPSYGVRNLMAHNGKQEPGNRRTRKKDKG